jgi:hypothetical protein
MSPPSADDRSPVPSYRAYLLRLWRDGDNATWHASLQATDAPERIGFGDFDELVAYLRLLLEVPHGSPGAPPDD